MSLRKQLLITTAALALAPFAAQATPTTWVGGTSNAWTLAGNWTAGAPTTTSAVTINSVTTPNVSPLITTAVLLNATSGTNVASLAITSGGLLTIGAGGSLAMGTHVTTLSGGTLTSTGSGVMTGTGAIQGYGTFSAADTGSPNFNANSSSGALTLTGGGTLSGTLTTSTAGGGINLTGDTFSGSTAGSGGAINLNGATLKNVTLSNSGGQQLNVTGDSTLSGTIGWSQYDTFNIGGTNGAHTLNLNTAGTTTLSTVSGGANPFVIGTGGVLNNQSGIATMGGGGTVTLNGGSITGTSSGLFTIGDPISGNGTISGNVDLNAGNETVSGGTLTLNGVTIGSSSSGPGIGVGAGNILDLQGNISAFSFNVNPGTGGLVQFDGTTISKAGTGNTNINNNGLTTTGTFSVVKSSTLNNVNFSTGNGANLTVSAPLTVTGGGTLNATNVTVNSAGALNLTNTTGTTTLTTNNLTLANGSTLDVASGHNGISLTGNFSYQQTDTVHGWTNGATAGLGPDLTMTGKNNTLEAGGAIGGGYSTNFALDSLTLGSNAFIALVNQFANAAQGYGTEALYVDNLFGVVPGTGVTIPTLNLDGIMAFDQSCPLTDLVCGPGGQLSVGLYIDANGGEINIINNPEPATLAVLASGLLGLGLIRRRRRN